MTETPFTSEADPRPPVRERYDVVVIGGGPAGATAGALTAEAGLSTLIFERSAFPRFHIGESLIPETYWTLKRLGLIERLRETAFPRKYSVQFVGENGKESAPFYFDEHNPHESSQTWQVVRGEFDRMLLRAALEKGAEAATDARVLEVLFDGEQARGVRVQLGRRCIAPDGGENAAGAKRSEPPPPAAGGDGSDVERRARRLLSLDEQFASERDDRRESHPLVRDIAADVVVDATGQSAFLAGRLGLKQPDRRLKKGTVWTYFQGAQRDRGKDEGATIILQTEGKKSWFWYIPLPEDVTSVGCTGSMFYMFAKGRGAPEETFEQELARCPVLQRRLAGATRCTGYFTTKDFSYRASKAAGDGWVLVGDAFGFIDPVYSTGVFLALKSGEMAADAIVEAVRRGDFSAASLGSWQEEYVKGVELFRRLVYAFYTPGFSFGEFLRRHPRYRSHLVDILIGAVFKPGVGEMFEAMGEVLPPVDQG